MKIDRRSFLSFVIGGAAGTALSPLPYKLTDDLSIWSQNWPWTPVPPDGDGDDDGGIASQWWFWTIIGALVAGGAATGIYFGLTASEGPSGSDAPQLIMEF